MKLHAIVLVTLSVLRIGTLHANGDAGFFEAFALGSRGWGLARFHFAAGKLPQAGKRHAVRPFPNQQPAFVFNDCHGNRCGCGSHCCRRSRL
jgi:hypothetical protein